MDIRQEIAVRAQQIDRIIKKYLPKEEGYQKTLLQAMNYSVLAGGKRLRPMLMSETYRLFGGRSEIIEPFMAAMEMLHTYSLVHDDLPAMDDDEYRRGKKTTHAVYGEAMAILAGDGLLNLAYETALSALEKEPSNPGVAKALGIFAERAGIYGMVGGQSADVESEGRHINEDKLNFIYRLKTGALIEASMLMGAVLAGAAAGELRMIAKIAGRAGLAFQIQDDILDVTGSQEILGKPVGSDDKNKKETYVTLKGLKQAREDADRLTGEAVSALDALAVKNDFLKALLIHLTRREK